MSVNKGGRPKGYIMSQKTKDMISVANKGNKSRIRKAVSINGVKYKSILEASKMLDLARGTLTNRINSNNTMWQDWFYL